MNKITVAVVDDHKLIIEMYAQMFLDNEIIEIVGESRGFEEAVELIRIKQPDVVLLDINLGKHTGFELLPLIRRFSPKTKIIAVSMYTQSVIVRKMMLAGASGYVTKNSSKLEIINAIQQVMYGKVYVCREIKNIRVNQSIGDQPREPVLTSRELEIIHLIKRGYTSKEIAIRSSICLRTVKVHRYNIFRKLKINNMASLHVLPL